MVSMSAPQPIQLQPAPIADDKLLPVIEEASSGCCGGGACGI
jgi:hypothetical protein